MRCGRTSREEAHSKVFGNVGPKFGCSSLRVLRHIRLLIQLVVDIFACAGVPTGVQVGAVAQASVCPGKDDPQKMHA